MMDRRWKMGKKTYVHAMYVQKERKGLPNSLKYYLIELGMLHYLYCFQL